VAFPLSFLDISLLLGVTATVLLITSELISPYCGTANLKINKKRLRNTALLVSALFLATVAIRIATVL
jgi:hypothetical protein